MLNYNDILSRIQEVMKNNELTSSLFAERLGVQRSGISHILSGRNKPSLEFLSKIHFSFESVSIQWLLFGEKKTVISKNKLNTFTETPGLKKTSVDKISQNENNQLLTPNKIIIFYNDKSFIEYNPKS